ncbi:GNAT family N-acetyltransferase [Microlunatus parietis]|uniref:Ribosomal protein S18 acetylase RimI-like enzyme n=1 Tax=Microlunatus parietis TaxID=682979 RepID=A0A7Y9LEI8_9ACTN|nr:GNAT family N-acetyltransferase [Microlunatus parietis]NYE75017.1 ribosomal protein S18 acetylase RimI-like enzyme [Microlunatus parietis]
MAKYKPRRALIEDDNHEDAPTLADLKREPAGPQRTPTPPTPAPSSPNASTPNASTQNPATAADTAPSDAAPDDTVVIDPAKPPAGPAASAPDRTAETLESQYRSAADALYRRPEEPTAVERTAETQLLAPTLRRTGDRARSRQVIKDDADFDEPEESPADRASRRVWRIGRRTIVLVTILTVLVVAALGTLAYLIFRDARSLPLTIGLGALALLLLIYVWRMVWHPRLVATGSKLTVYNPLSKRVIPWSDVTLVQPGPNGMIIGTDRDQVEAWCVQKGRSALKRGHHTRADRIAAELWRIWDSAAPALTDEQGSWRIRRARPDEAQLLTRLERAASEHALGHIFPPNRFPYPVADVARRWQRTLAERQVRVRILEVGETPAAFIAYDHETVRHLGVLPRHTRKGFGTALLSTAEEDVFSSGGAQVQLWVLTENRAARAFYRAHGWTETEDRRRSEFPPKPDELRMIKVHRRGERSRTE